MYAMYIFINQLFLKSILASETDKNPTVPCDSSSDDEDEFHDADETTE